MHATVFEKTTNTLLKYRSVNCGNVKTFFICHTRIVILNEKYPGLANLPWPVPKTHVEVCGLMPQNIIVLISMNWNIRLLLYSKTNLNVRGLEDILKFNKYNVNLCILYLSLDVFTTRDTKLQQNKIYSFFRFIIIEQCGDCE